jgi:hypothetical protein
MCKDINNKKPYKWRVRNQNNIDINVDWEIYNNKEIGSLIAYYNEDTFFYSKLGGTMKIYWPGGESTKASNEKPCSTPSPTENPSTSPTLSPTLSPTESPTKSPT